MSDNLLSVELEQAKDLILNLVEQAGAPGVLGSLLGLELRRLMPDFQMQRHGFRKLRPFIDVHLPQVVAIASAGGDIRYGLAGERAPTPHRSGEAAHESLGAWRVWASPNAPFVLRLEDDRLTEVPRPLANTGDIEPLTANDHVEIARRFLEAFADRMEGVDVAALNAILSDHSPGWWTAWTSALERVSSTFGSEWLAFRRQEMERLLADALVARSVPQPNATEVAKRTAADGRRRPPGRLGAANGNGLRMAFGGGAQPGQEAALRELAVLIVGSMPEGELRDLRVSLGAVADALSMMNKATR